MENETTTDTSSNTNSKNPLVIIILFVAVLAIIFFALNRSSNSSETSTSTSTGSISGVIDFNGISPEDASDPDAGQIIVKARKSNTTDEFVDTGVQVMFTDRASWVWNDAASGTNYDLMGEVYYKDQLIKQSVKITTTAPATNIPIVFNITTADIPENLRPEPQPEAATISGTVTVNGFIPQGSVLRTYARLEGSDADFQQVGNDVPAVNSMTFSYAQATAGTTYEVQVELYDANDNFIGQSPYITVSAPAQNEQIVVNSTAQAPSQSATITGTITVNGPFDQNSTVLLLQRRQGDTEYTPITRFEPRSSINFEWTDAVSGVRYDITTALQVNENNVATGNVSTVTAPASAVQLTLNTGVNIAPPTSMPSVTCGNADATNHFNAQVNVPQISGAQKYSIQVGDTPGSNNMFGGTVAPNTHATVFLQGNISYFTRYAYSNCADCDLNDQSNWSGWSPTFGFQCPNAVAVPMPY